jgi:hypothetical protein
MQNFQIAGNSFIALTTALLFKNNNKHQGNDLGYGKNVKDWLISNQISYSALII